MAALDERQFGFERELAVGCERQAEQARLELEVLLTRLGITGDAAAKLGESERRLLTKYCIEVPLNIAWYDVAKKRVEKKLQRVYVLVVFCVLVAVLVLAGLAWVKDELVSAQVGTLVLAFGVVLQVLSGGADTKAQLGAFWRASSDLKEGLFTFLHSWQGRAIDAEGRLGAEFEVALWQELSNARRVCREEREAYFATYRSPTEIANLVTQPLSDLRMRLSEVGAVRGVDQQVGRDLAREATFQLSGARRALIEAKAIVAQRRAKLDALIADKAAEPDVTSAKLALSDAEAEVVRATEVLRMQAKSELTNP